MSPYIPIAKARGFTATLGNVINYRKGIKNCTIFKIMYNGHDFSLTQIIEEHLEGL